MHKTTRKQKHAKAVLSTSLTHRGVVSKGRRLAPPQISWTIPASTWLIVVSHGLHWLAHENFTDRIFVQSGQWRGFSHQSGANDKPNTDFIQWARCPKVWVPLLEFAKEGAAIYGGGAQGESRFRLR